MSALVSFFVAARIIHVTVGLDDVSENNERSQDPIFFAPHVKSQNRLPVFDHHIPISLLLVVVVLLKNGGKRSQETYIFALLIP